MFGEVPVDESIRAAALEAEGVGAEKGGLHTSTSPKLDHLQASLIGG